MYAGWDVHSYSKSWAPFAMKYKSLLEQPITKENFSALVKKIQTKYSCRFPVLNKMLKIHTVAVGGYVDADLCDINVCQLLQVTWCSVLEADSADIFRGFQEILIDMGLHCVQGDSHRLFAYWIALKRSLDENKLIPQK